MRLMKTVSASLAALALLGGCHRGDADAPFADKAWVRLAPVPGRPAAAYLVIHGGKEPGRLIAIDSPQAGSSELHQSMKQSAPGGMSMGGSMMTMQRLDGIDVPAGGTLTFAPEGYHVMLFGVGPQVKPGAKMPLSVRFAKGEPLTIEAKVVAAGDSPPY
jgi:copper(I)-binding protein